MKKVFFWEKGRKSQYENNLKFNILSYNIILEF